MFQAVYIICREQNWQYQKKNLGYTEANDKRAFVRFYNIVFV